MKRKKVPRTSIYDQSTNGSGKSNPKEFITKINPTLSFTYAFYGPLPSPMTGKKHIITNN